MLHIDERVRDLAETGLDRLLIAGERLLAPRTRLVDARFAAAFIDERTRQRHAEAPDPRARSGDEIGELRALHPRGRGQREGRKERRARNADLCVGGDQPFLGLPDVGAPVDQARRQPRRRQRHERQGEDVPGELLRGQLELEPPGELRKLVLDERAVARNVAALHLRVGERRLRLVDIELGRKTRVEARLGDLERLAPRADGVVEHRDLGVERAQREISLRDAAGERDGDDVAAELVREQVGPRRLGGAR